MSQDTAEVLRKARSLIDKPEKWTKGNYALDAQGNGLQPEDEDGVCFCLSGALWHADPEGPWNAYDTLTNAIGRNIINFNDDAATTHADVLAALDRAIATAEAA